MQQTAVVRTKPPRVSSPLIRLVQNIVKFRALLLLMVPGLIVVIINQYLPIFGITMAFKNINYEDGIFFSPWAGLKNFEFLFATSDIWVAIRNTLIYNLIFIFLGTIASVTIALLLNEITNKRMSKLYQSTIIMPSFLSIVLVAFIVSTFLDTRLGIINKTILPLLGITPEIPIEWYQTPKPWYVILPIVNLWKGAGMGSILYLATLCGIDGEYYEAALIDGAKKIQQIWYITLPMLLPMVAILTILNLGSIIRADFGLFFQVTMDQPLLYPATDVFDTFVYRSLLGLGDVGMSSAASFVQSFVGCILIVAVNLVVKKIDDRYSMF